MRLGMSAMPMFEPPLPAGYWGVRKAVFEVQNSLARGIRGR